MFICMSCGVFLDDRGPDSTVRCASCRERAAEDDERRSAAA
jgi:DNA-directed RNA polymerase subunit RPC12/RpoP